MLGIGLASLLGAGGVLFWWKIAAPFSRVLQFSEEHSQEQMEDALSIPQTQCVPQEMYPDAPTDLGMTKAIVKLSTAVNPRAHDHAVAR
jgi:hypothetical protein